jgi:hypothetical protein
MYDFKLSGVGRSAGLIGRLLADSNAALSMAMDGLSLIVMWIESSVAMS